MSKQSELSTCAACTNLINLGRIVTRLTLALVVVEALTARLFLRALLSWSSFTNCGSSRIDEHAKLRHTFKRFCCKCAREKSHVQSLAVIVSVLLAGAFRSSSILPFCATSKYPHTTRPMDWTWSINPQWNGIATSIKRQSINGHLS